MATESCPKCNVALPAGAPAGICPKCLLEAGLQQLDGADRRGNSSPLTTAADAFLAPSPEQLAHLFPSLEIMQLLGQGGMGAVYKARQLKLDRLVALKIIRPESAHDSAFAERFNREARALARLNHPQIVAIHDFGEVSWQDESSSEPRHLYYFVMEYVEGANLRQLLQSGEMTAARALEIVPQICEALQFAHDEGVVHRDIKPENILVDSHGRVRIADFGLAKLASDNVIDHTLTGTHQVLGTPRYMAPEQMEGAQEVDHRADIYSLGVVFYEMLTGELPLGRFEPPSQKSTIHRKWDEVVLRALEKAPDKRYQNASEVKSEIQKTSDAPSPAQPGPTAVAAAIPLAHTVLPSSDAEGTIPNYGMLILGTVMICLGVLLAWGTSGFRDIVFVWIGIGIALGGSGCLAGAFSESGRLPAGTKPNYGMLLQGAVMLAIGGILLALCLTQQQGLWRFHVGNAFVWVGIGLAMGGGGCISAAWKSGSPGTADSRVYDSVLTRRFSRKAIVGACLAPLFFLLLIPMFTVTTSNRPSSGPTVIEQRMSSSRASSTSATNETADRSSAPPENAPTRSHGPSRWQWILLCVGLLVGLGAPIATTILGMVAISDIRYSDGRMVGLPLAVADAVFYPLLLVDALIVAAVLFLARFGLERLESEWSPSWSAAFGVSMLIALPLCIIIDYRIVKSIWRNATSIAK